MGLTELKIVFKEIKRKALEGASTGVVCLILYLLWIMKEKLTPNPLR